MAKAKRRASPSGEETRQNILEATLRTLENEGIVGASARAIARTGDFNQALIFYHFGSVDEAIVAAVGELSRRRLERYREPLMAVDNLADLIGVAREMYQSDRASGEVTILAQAFAGASRDPEMGPAMYDHIAAWNDLIEQVVDRSVVASADGPDSNGKGGATSRDSDGDLGALSRHRAPGPARPGARRHGKDVHVYRGHGSTGGVHARPLVHTGQLSRARAACS